MHKRLMTMVLLLLIVGFCACNRGQSRVTTTDEVSVAEYEVLSAWLDSKFQGQKTEHSTNVVSRIVIFDLPRSDEKRPRLDGNGQQIPWKDTASLLLARDPGLQQTTIAAFRE